MNDKEKFVANVDYAGNSGTNAPVAYQWYYAASEDAAEWTKIEGATEKGYKPENLPSGSFIKAGAKVTETISGTEYTTEELVEVLEPFQQVLILDLLSQYSEEEALQIWLTVSGPEHTATFGGSGFKDYFKNFKYEFDNLILGEGKYKDCLKELNEYATISKFFIVAFLSTKLSESMGVAAGVVAPLIVLSLGIVGKIGLNAYRNMIREYRKSSSENN